MFFVQYPLCVCWKIQYDVQGDVRYYDPGTGSQAYFQTVSRKNHLPYQSCHAMPLPCVQALSSSDSDSEGNADVEDVRAVFGRSRNKRKNTPASPAIDKTSMEHLRILPQKRCGGKCRLECLKQFQKSSELDKLVRFRQEWKERHKVDQDRVAI